MFLLWQNLIYDWLLLCWHNSPQKNGHYCYPHLLCVITTQDNIFSNSKLDFLLFYRENRHGIQNLLSLFPLTLHVLCMNPLVNVYIMGFVTAYGISKQAFSVLKQKNIRCLHSSVQTTKEDSYVGLFEGLYLGNKYDEMLENGLTFICVGRLVAVICLHTNKPAEIWNLYTRGIRNFSVVLACSLMSVLLNHYCG